MSIKFFYNFCLKDDDKTSLDGDILSGVRRSYFSGFERIKDKITVNSDTESLTYDYLIEKDKQARWMVKSSDGKTLQETVSSDGGKYFIYFYRDQTLYKRLLFSRLHTLLRVEYFDAASGIPVISLEPRKAQNGLCILYSSRMMMQPLVIYPEPDITDERVRERMADFCDYTVVASTNDGIIRFLSEEQIAAFKARTEKIEQEIAAEKEQVYVSDGTPLHDRLNAKDFNVKRNLATALDITKAEEFSVIPAEAETAEDACETIASEPPQQAVTEDNDIVKELSEVDEVAESVALAAAEAIRKAAENTAPDDADADQERVIAPADVSESIEAQAEEESKDNISSETVAKPDKQIMADGAIYSYYGELDENGNRSGYGRTMTDEGRTAYEGRYRNDKRSGKGSYFYKDGSLCYTGDWIENARHGVGVGVSSQDGSMHVGRWALNKPVGSGVRLSADGEIKFVCKELSDGTTVLMNYMPDDTVVIAKYDENGKKLGEQVMSLKDFLS